MKKIIFICSLILPCFSLSGQEFITPIYIVSDSGETDTLYIGYDPEATIDLDESFGEEELDYNDFSSTKTFLVQLGIEIIECSPISGQYTEIEDALFYRLEKDILPKECLGYISNSGRNGHIPNSGVLIPNNRFPLKIKWDSTAFDNLCLYESYFTDSGLFGYDDFSCTSVDFYKRNMANFGTLEVEQPTGVQTIMETGDTATIIGVVLADSLWSNVHEKEIMEFKIFPNPTYSTINISTQDRIKQVEIYSISGRLIRIYSRPDTQVEIADPGIYFIRIEDVLGKVAVKKVVVR